MSAVKASPSSSRVRVLRDLNTDDLLRAAGLSALASEWPPLRRLFDAPSLILARKLAVFDEVLGRGEVWQACRELLTDLGTQVRVLGQIPAASGPRLFVANHPGLGDVLSLLSALPGGVRIIARERPFLQALPNLSSHLFFLSSNSWTILRQVEPFLAQGGAVLTFPAGRIEPDPAWADPSATWDQWSESTAVLARRVPGLMIQPLLVAGVRARGFVDPWAARWRRRPEDRDWTAAVLQLVFQVLLGRPRRSRIDVAVGLPIAGASFLPGGRGPAELRRSLETMANRLSRR